MEVSATISNDIRVQEDSIPRIVQKQIIDALTIPNWKRKEARNAGYSTYNIPETIKLWDRQNGHLCIPRGFHKGFEFGLRAHGISVAWQDERVFDNGLVYSPDPIQLRPWQEPAVEAILEHKQGVISAPAASGKTVVVLAAIQRLGCKSLVIVNTRDILWQWQERIEQFLGPGLHCGQIGDNTFDVSAFVTVATAQTLHKRADRLMSDGFFNQFSLVCVDESHHSQSSSYSRLIGRFPAKYRFGVSATPKKTGDFRLISHVLGPIIHRTAPAEVTMLEMPAVKVVETEFNFPFRPARPPRTPSNYMALITALVKNDERNELIAKCIVDNVGHHQLVFSKRIEHLARIKRLLKDMGFPDRILTLTGKDSDVDRQAVKNFAAEHPCVILSTLAEEGFDLSRLDRAHLAYPQRNPGAVIQQVGRVERVHEEKSRAVIYDYVDRDIGVLYNQFMHRRFEVYKQRNYKVGS